MLMKITQTKEQYLSPESEVLELKSEGVVCASGELEDNKYENVTW